MSQAKLNGLFTRFDAAEVAVCVLINRGSQRAPVRRFFGIVSRLGDGVFWYTLLALIPLVYGAAGIAPTLHMGVVALIGVAVYKYLKQHLVRERPFMTHSTISCGSEPLDRYSFPSGHTLHAASFTTLLMHHFPEVGWAVLPFALLVAASRVILGLHYPTDVLAGALIGGGLASASVYLVQ